MWGRTANAETPQVTDVEDHAAADATTTCPTPCRVPGAERRTCEDSDAVGLDCGVSAGAAVSCGTRAEVESVLLAQWLRSCCGFGTPVCFRQAAIGRAR
jgi:hypothetical protein